MQHAQYLHSIYEQVSHKTVSNKKNYASPDMVGRKPQRSNIHAFCIITKTRFWSITTYGFMKSTSNASDKSTKTVKSVCKFKKKRFLKPLSAYRLYAGPFSKGGNAGNLQKVLTVNYQTSIVV